ncbi:MAG TPA: LPS export ABC transporter periplasmic protein LptC [Campylobacterales bacterium]|nr:LPS export ABC transporter periplasmic protein LptC [Campylobacterales bacterium]HHS91865.1 LPS export ABC transporter periplasmic protein LptC [Campylobacterales bacterium]
MAVRIEYFLLLLLGILVASIIGINPSSHDAKSSKGEKEIEFENFSLYNIQEDESMEEIFAEKLVKYPNHLEMSDINLKDEEGYQLFSNEAVYEEEHIYMDSGVKILSDDGLKFITTTLNYNVETKDIETQEPFLLEYNASIIKGENLVLNMNSKIISADNIDAKIYFISE